VKKTIVILSVLIFNIILQANEQELMKYKEYKACKKGNKQACQELEKAYNTDMCSASNTKACVKLGKTYYQEDNKIKAIESFTKGCNLSSAEGCVLTAMVYETLPLTKENNSKIKRYYTKGCVLKNVDSCNRVISIIKNELKKF